MIKKYLITIIIILVSGMAGYAIGIYKINQITLSRKQLNYSTIYPLEREANSDKSDLNFANSAPTSTVIDNNSNDEECYIKGNISSKSKIYHMPDGSFYDRTQAEQCFASEQEAIENGFVKASR